uniref:Nicalin n=1 Tax=Glossina brevipalpis TaxID=37001 RepID=A0A1A9WUW2_9MUSC
MFEDADNFADIFRGGAYLLLTLPILILCSSNPVLASSEFAFAVHRMTQFDLNGVSFGCRSSSLSLEARSLYSWKTARHCVVARLQDMTIDGLKEIRQKAGGLVLLLPQDVASMSAEEKNHINFLEQAMMTESISIPVYFSIYNPELENIITDITRSTSVTNKQNQNNRFGGDSALSEIFNFISANGYQVVVSGASHMANKNSKIPIIQGELAPYKQPKKNLEINLEQNSKVPSIVIAAHLNTFGLYNEYPLNVDAAVLMTLADIFSKLHNMPNAIPKYRLLFLLSESGQMLNFQGIKKWLDENNQLQSVEFVLCLDTITEAFAQVEENNTLYLHVSKPPKENTPLNNFFKYLKIIGLKYYNITIEGIHKKINLADKVLAWEHERFSIKRLPAFTLSALSSAKSPTRNTIFKRNENDILQQAEIKAKIIAETLATYIYSTTVLNASEGEIYEILSEEMQINSTLIKAYLNLRSALHNNDLKNGFEKYMQNIKIIYDKPEARDPDFMLYEGYNAILNIYRVKPAIFDLFLTIGICCYLTSIYFSIQFFPLLYTIVCNALPRSSTVDFMNNSHSDRQKFKSN